MNVRLVALAERPLLNTRVVFGGLNLNVLTDHYLIFLFIYLFFFINFRESEEGAGRERERKRNSDWPRNSGMSPNLEWNWRPSGVWNYAQETEHSGQGR